MGPEDQHPWDAQDEEIRQAFAKKDAEIERLKEYNANQLALLEENQREIERLSRIAKSQYALITELCDSLEGASQWPPHQLLIQRAMELVTRARKATR